MTGKNGVCRTVGYVDPISGAEIMFEKPLKRTEGKKLIDSRKAIGERVITRKLNNEWDELDAWIYPEIDEVMAQLQWNRFGEMFIAGRKVA